MPSLSAPHHILQVYLQPTLSQAVISATDNRGHTPTFRQRKSPSCKVGTTFLSSPPLSCTETLCQGIVIHEVHGASIFG